MRRTSKIKIALCDVRHRTLGLHSCQMPLGVGLIAAYIKKHLGSDVEVRLYKYMEPFLEDLKQWQPNIVGGSFFSWNRRLSLLALEKTKEYCSDALTVLGGPELDIEKSKRLEFLRENSYVDICCIGEGEETFLEIVSNYMHSADCCDSEGMDGAFFLLDDGKTLFQGKCRKRISSLDDIPSPYSTGLFDKFFDDYLHPFIETHRGCPFTCGFCCMGIKDTSKITYQSVDRTMEDLQYCAERYKGRHDMVLCIGDNNFGMYAKDVELAKGIRRLQDEYDWPRYMIVNTGKNKKDQTVEISNILKWGLPFNMAVQSLNEKTLKAIARSNISFDIMKETLDAVNNQSTDTFTELIIGMPLETRESFEVGIKKMIDIDINWICIYTLQLLKSTWLDMQKTRDAYNLNVKYRVICRQFGEYDGRRIIEIGGAVVGTNTMSIEDYCYLRELTYIIQIVYNSDAFNSVRRFLKEHNIDIWQWIREVHSMTLKSKGKTKKQLDNFMKETRDELFDSEEAIIEYFANDSNYNKLLTGEVGDNLINKYSVLAHSEAFNEWLDIACTAARKLLVENECGEKYAIKAMRNIEKYIQMVYNFSTYFYHPPEPEQHQEINFDYNIHCWYKNKSLSLDDCHEPTIYDVYFSEEKVKQIKQLLKSSHDVSLTIQHVYRDKSYADLIPVIKESISV